MLNRFVFIAFYLQNTVTLSLFVSLRLLCFKRYNAQDEKFPLSVVDRMLFSA